MSDERIAALIEEGERLMKEATALPLPWGMEISRGQRFIYQAGSATPVLEALGFGGAQDPDIISALTTFAVNSLPALVAAVKEQGRWQPIETAPRDRIRVIGATEDFVIGDIFYGRSNGSTVETWRYSEGERRVGSHIMPTFWQPLPDPPSGEEVNDNGK